MIFKNKIRNSLLVHNFHDPERNLEAQGIYKAVEIERIFEEEDRLVDRLEQVIAN